MPERDEQEWQPVKLFENMSPNEVGRAAQPAFRTASFRTASFCNGGECVEVAQRDGMIVLRDSTQPRGIMLHYAVGDWGSFVRNIKSGQLDDLGS